MDHCREVQTQEQTSQIRRRNQYNILDETEKDPFKLRVKLCILCTTTTSKKWGRCHIFKEEIDRV